MTGARALVAALVLALLPAFAQGQPALTTLRVGATPVDDMPPLLYAMRTGIFAKAGIKVELTQMTSGASIAVSSDSDPIENSPTSSP